MRHAARTDDNHAAIRDDLRRAGKGHAGAVWSVVDLSGAGNGVPDLLVGLTMRGGQRRNLLLEIKDGAKVQSRRRLTPDQAKWHTAWRGQVAVVDSTFDALALIHDAIKEGGEE